MQHKIAVIPMLRFAFDLAYSYPEKYLTSAMKSNRIAISMPCWDEWDEERGKHYAEVCGDKYLIDILADRFVLSPEHFDVAVASNLFGDIHFDLGPACAGMIGIAPSANPIAMIWSGAMMLDFLGNGDVRYKAAHDAIIKVIETVLVDGPRTPDLGALATTTESGLAIANAQETQVC